MFLHTRSIFAWAGGGLRPAWFGLCMLLFALAAPAQAQLAQAVSGNNQVIAVGATSAPMVAQFQSVEGPVAGSPVNWSFLVLDGSASASLATSQNTADNLGRAANTLIVSAATPSSPTAGGVIIEVRASGPGGTVAFSITVLAGTPAGGELDPCLLQQRVSALSGMALASLDAQRRNLHERLRQLRLQRKAALAGVTPPHTAGLAAQLATGEREAAEAAEGAPRGWGAFASADVERAELDSGAAGNGFDLQTQGLTLGGDYSFEGNHVLGAGIGFLSADTDLHRSGETQEARGISFSLFGSYVPSEDTYLDLIATWGRNRYKLRRASADIALVGAAGGGFVCPGLPLQTQAQVPQAGGDPKGRQYLISITGGWDLSRGALSFGPYFRIDHLRARVDGYDEVAAPGVALRVSEQTARQQRFALGMQASRAIGMSWGVLIPNARLEWERQFGKRSDAVAANRIANALVTLSASPLTEDRSYGNLALGVQGQFPHGISAFVSFEKQFAKQDFDRNRVTMGIGIPF
jgi:uncharacterized protein YhjY with autotransporter beta-barrel domain